MDRSETGINTHTSSILPSDLMLFDRMYTCDEQVQAKDVRRLDWNHRQRSVWVSKNVL